MNASDEDEIGDTGRLLFGAGFVFGVLCTLLVLIVVVATATGEGGQGLIDQDVFTTIVAGILFIAVVGIAMYVLAFPENRESLPTDELRAGGGSADEDETPGTEEEKQ